MNAFGSSSFLTVLLCLGLGLFVYFKNRKRKLNQLWLMLSVSIAMWGAGGFAISFLQEPSVALQTWRWTAILGISWIPVFFYQFICELCGLSRPKIIFTHYVVALASCILYATTDLLFKGTRYIFGEFYWNEIGPLHPFYLAWWSGAVLHAHLEVWNAFRRSSGILKSQLKWTMIAFVVGFSFGILGFLPNYHIDLYPWGNFAIPLYPVIMAYGIFRYQLFDISLVIRKSLVYSILITLLTAGYFGLVYGIEWVFRTTLGYHSIWLSLTAFALMALVFQPLKNSIQRLVDWLIFRTPQEQLIKRMERLEEQAFQAEKFKAISTLAAGMAHEIKNPLTALQTFGEFIPEKGADPKFRKKLQEVFTIETRRIREIVQEVLDFSKPRAPQSKEMEIGPLISSTVDFLSNELIKHRIQWTIDCQHNGVTLHADSDQLRQVLINLIQNAADAMPNGGSLTIATQAVNSHLELTISDTGSGIPSALLPKIFDPFVTTKPDGNGLGLAVVYSIIQAHRGSIRAESPGRLPADGSVAGGTTFTVSLPT